MKKFLLIKGSVVKVDGEPVELLDSVFVSSATWEARNEKMTKHKWTGAVCLAMHHRRLENGDYETLPQCKRCEYCGLVEWPYDKECQGES